MLVRPAALDDAAAIAQIYRPLVEGTSVSFELGRYSNSFNAF